MKLPDALKSNTPELLSQIKKMSDVQVTTPEPHLIYVKRGVKTMVFNTFTLRVFFYLEKKGKRIDFGWWFLDLDACEISGDWICPSPGSHIDFGTRADLYI